MSPDIVHVHNVMNPAALREAVTHPRTVVTVQDHRMFCPARGKLTLLDQRCTDVMDPEICAECFLGEEALVRMYSVTRERWQAVRERQLIVLSQYMRSELELVGAEHIQVIPPFVDGLDLHAEADGPPCVLFVGRLVLAKGVHPALEAYQQMQTELPLVFAGTGTLRGELPNVTGWLSRKALSRLYRRAEVLLFPPKWQEPFGIAGLEALAMGVPVAAWESGGIGDWHPGPLTPWDDTQALAAHANELIGTTPDPPTGFEREPLMERLHEVYESL